MYSSKLFVIFFIVSIIVIIGDGSATTDNKKGQDLPLELEHNPVNLKTCKLNVATSSLLKAQKGERGLPGQKGEKGSNNQQGIVGEKGHPGTPAPCCRVEKPSDDHDTVHTNDDPNFGTKDNPAKVTCCLAPKDKPSGTYFMGPKNSPFEVYCNMETRATCISTKTLTKPLQYNETNPFWLSEKGLDLKAIYGLTNAQIEWLQKRSSTVNQTLRYYCKNSVPYSSNDVSKSIRLVMWNDVIIDARNKDLPSFVYKVPSETDGCSKQSKTDMEEKSADIIITMKEAKKLPVIDFQIRDTRGEHQTLTIANEQLCFGCK